MEQKEYWNNVSGKKEFTTPFQMEKFSEYVNTEGTIVDIGCGYGRTLDGFLKTHQSQIKRSVGF